MNTTNKSIQKKLQLSTNPAVRKQLMHDKLVSAPKADPQEEDPADLKIIQDFVKSIPQTFNKDSFTQPSAQETLDAIDEVKEIASKYGHQDNFLEAKKELRAIADKLHMPFSISEENSFPLDTPPQDITTKETRQRTITLGKKGSGLEQVFKVPAFNPHLEKPQQVDLKQLIQHESPEHRTERRALSNEEHMEDFLAPLQHERVSDVVNGGIHGGHHNFRTALGQISASNSASHTLITSSAVVFVLIALASLVGAFCLFRSMLFPDAEQEELNNINRGLANQNRDQLGRDGKKQKAPKIERQNRDQNARGMELSELNSSMSSSRVMSERGSNSRTGRQYTAFPVNDMGSQYGYVPKASTASNFSSDKLSHENEPQSKPNASTVIL